MKIISTVLGVLLCCSAAAQEDVTYMHKYGNGRPGVTTVTPELKPDAGRPYLLITGISFSECDKKGAPKKDFRETLVSIQDATSRQIELLGNSTKVGGFTYDCRQLTYYYLKDTADMRTVLETFYKQNFPEYPYQIHMRPDPRWDVYGKHLYPDKGRGAVLPPQQ